MYDIANRDIDNGDYSYYYCRNDSGSDPRETVLIWI